MASIETLARTIADRTQPDMTPDDLFQAVRQRHPKASKKDIRSAAFYALILLADANPMKIAELHDLALRARRQPHGHDE